MPRVLCHRCQHREHQCTGVTVNHTASDVLPRACSMAKCHPCAARWVIRMVSQGPCMAQAWRSGLCMGSHCAALCHTVSSPASSSFQLGGWLPSRAAAEPCPVRPQLHPPPSLAAAACSCAWPRGGSLTAPVPSKAGRVLFGDCALLCPSLGKLSIELIEGLWQSSLCPGAVGWCCFSLLSVIVLGQGRPGQAAVGRALGEREAEKN